MNGLDQRKRLSSENTRVAAVTPSPHPTEPIRVRDLDTRLLLAFRAVAVEGTFGRAASRLGYTQSAVSQQIAALEAVIGEPLFERHGGPKPVTLTPLGGVLLDRVRELLGVLESITTDVAN
jgi:DNA-binding transcriptional LysR family regulator